MKAVADFLEETPAAFAVGVTISVARSAIGTGISPILLHWSDENAPTAEEPRPGRLRRKRLKVQRCNEVEIVGRARIVHINTDPDMRIGTADCDVNSLANVPRVIIEAENAKVIR